MIKRRLKESLTTRHVVETALIYPDSEQKRFLNPLLEVVV